MRLVLVQALAKGDRDEQAIEAATELGVDEVVPWAGRALDRRVARRARRQVAGEVGLRRRPRIEAVPTSPYAAHLLPGRPPVLVGRVGTLP